MSRWTPTLVATRWTSWVWFYIVANTLIKDVEFLGEWLLLLIDSNVLLKHIFPILEGLMNSQGTTCGATGLKVDELNNKYIKSSISEYEDKGILRTWPAQLNTQYLKWLNSSESSRNWLSSRSFTNRQGRFQPTDPGYPFSGNDNMESDCWEH